MIVKIKGEGQSDWHFFDNVDDIYFAFEPKEVPQDMLSKYDVVIQQKDEDSSSKGVELILYREFGETQILFDTHAYICNNDGQKIQKLNGTKNATPEQTE